MKFEIKYNYIVFGFVLYAFGFTGCKKLVDVGEPPSTVTSTEVFSTSDQANSVIAGIYSRMMTNNGNLEWSNGAATIYGGLSSDELVNYGGVSNDADYQFFTNTLLNNNNNSDSYFWQAAYKNIYDANAAIAGLTASKSNLLDAATKSDLLGEAKFLRAFSYFYLTNLYGDVPLVLITDVNQTKLAKRVPQPQVYQQIIQDLKDAQATLPVDFAVGGGERIRANRYAAMALLARVYLYQKLWTNAYAEADSVISNSQFSLVTDLTQVFNANSTEAILQFQQYGATNQNPRNGTWDGYSFIPKLIWSHIPSGTQSNYLSSLNTYNSALPALLRVYYLSNELGKAFEAGDQRKVLWLDSVPNPTGNTYYYPFKYTLGITTNSPANKYGNSSTIPQYYMVLRLAEQFLIRAEAEADGAGGGLPAAVADLNVIRSRAGLPNYAGAMDQTAVLAAIIHERQVELFAEWGHRWLDLKRWGIATSVLSTNKKITVSSNSLVYPIPLTELQQDPNLTQNPGY